MAIPVAVAKLSNGTQNESVLYSAISGGSVTRDIVATSSTFTSPATAISTYQYVLLEKPTGSSASLTNATSATCTLNSIDVAGTYRVFLKVVDDQSQSSQTDILKSPDTAFIQVHVKTQYLDVVKPASGERNWTTFYHAFIDAVDALKNTVNGITTPTATSTVLGSVRLGESPLSASNPEALTIQRKALTTVVNGQAIRSEKGQVVYSPNIQTTLADGATTHVGPQSPALVAFLPNHLHDSAKAFEVAGIGFTLLDGGSKVGAGEKYVFRVFHCTKTQFDANDVSNFTTVGKATLVPDANKPRSTNATLASPVTIPHDSIILVTCGSHPSGLGGGLTVTLDCQIRY